MPTGTHANPPVQMSAADGIGVGHQGTVARSAGVAVSGRRRQPGTSMAASVNTGNQRADAGVPSREVTASGLDTVT
jgi:hypothetical protein